MTTPADDPVEQALELLRTGRYAEGWPLFEARTSRTKGPYMRCGLPEWQGESLAGKRLFLAGEQGIGDEVQFGRFVPRLKALGAHVIASVLPMNQRLFQQLGADVVMDRLVRNDLRADVTVGLLSLPLRLGCFHEDDFGRQPYLRAPSPRAGGGVGVVWRGRPEHGNDANRSLPSPDLLLRLPNARLLEPQGDTIESLNDLAGLDALVTVDTSWAHLAGALGLPCHILLSRISTDWRWGVNRSDSPWYESVRLYRQRIPGVWDHPIEDVRRALSE